MGWRNEKAEPSADDGLGYTLLSKCDLCHIKLLPPKYLPKSWMTNNKIKECNILCLSNQRSSSYFSSVQNPSRFDSNPKTLEKWSVNWSGLGISPGLPSLGRLPSEFFGGRPRTHQGDYTSRHRVTTGGAGKGCQEEGSASVVIDCC